MDSTLPQLKDSRELLLDAYWTLNGRAILSWLELLTLLPNHGF